VGMGGGVKFMGGGGVMVPHAVDGIISSPLVNCCNLARLHDEAAPVVVPASPETVPGTVVLTATCGAGVGVGVGAGVGVGVGTGPGVCE